MKYRPFIKEIMQAAKERGYSFTLSEIKEYARNHYQRQFYTYGF